jgi:hypothetical protein
MAKAPPVPSTSVAALPRTQAEPAYAFTRADQVDEELAMELAGLVERHTGWTLLAVLGVTGAAAGAVLAALPLFGVAGAIAVGLAGGGAGLAATRLSWRRVVADAGEMGVSPDLMAQLRKRMSSFDMGGDPRRSNREGYAHAFLRSAHRIQAREARRLGPSAPPEGPEKPPRR